METSDATSVILTLNNKDQQDPRNRLSKRPFTRSDSKDPILGSKSWKQAFRRSDYFKVPFLW